MVSDRLPPSSIENRTISNYQDQILLWIVHFQPEDRKLSAK